MRSMRPGPAGQIRLELGRALRQVERGCGSGGGNGSSILRIILLVLLYFVGLSGAAIAQGPASGPPSVGVVRAQTKPLTESSEFIGRIQAVSRVNLVARVTGFLEQRFFEEGAEVKNGDLLYRIEQPPFKADVDAKRAVVDQLKAQLVNAQLTLDRAKSLLGGPAGQQSTYDAALASQKALEAQVLGAQAQLEQSQINLAYTEIHAPIDGKIGRTTITEGNVVGPSSGTLATIVSQDPIYVTFPVSVRAIFQLRDQYATKGGFNAVALKVRLSDGRIYGQTGHLNFLDNTVAPDTDTLIVRGTIPNPPLNLPDQQKRPRRELFDGMFVTAIIEGVQPVMSVTVPRAAILSDQQGDFVYVVDGDNKAQVRRVQLAQSTPSTAFIASGLKEGELVVLEGLQRVRPGQPVLPGPAAARPSDATPSP
jgi:membrane fusion protein, multidrug efflux system